MSKDIEVKWKQHTKKMKEILSGEREFCFEEFT